MNIRLLAVLTAATLLTVSSGCAPFRNFFFGRGARCGSCNQPTAIAAPCNQPMAQAYTTTQSCGCNPAGGGMPSASDNFGPAMTPHASNRYGWDKDGATIIHSEELPPGAVAPSQ